MKIYLAAFALAFAKYALMPDMELLICLLFAMTADLITGVMKAYCLKEARTSRGFRQSIAKFTQYLGGILGSMFLRFLSTKAGIAGGSAVVGMFGDGILVYMIYIEVLSFFENLYACNPEGQLSKIFRIGINVLTFQMKNNPATSKFIPDEQKERTATDDGAQTG